jgi:iron complex transport system substrate-binding protein
MIQIPDPFQNVKNFHPPYRRIVSLIPSISESLIEMGATEQIVGITSYCVSPRPQVLRIPKIGGTKTPDIEKIRQLDPDLIIANVEENRKEDVQRLETVADLFLNFPKSISDTKELLEHLAQLTGRSARPFLNQIDSALHELKPVRGVVLYLIWNEPYWTIGEDTYIADMLRIQGLTNATAARSLRYFPLTDEEMASSGADYILLPSEPFRFRNLHREELALRYPFLKAVRDGRVILLDGRMTSWFGTRTGGGIEYLNRLLA